MTRRCGQQQHGRNDLPQPAPGHLKRECNQAADRQRRNRGAGRRPDDGVGRQENDGEPNDAISREADQWQAEHERLAEVVFRGQWTDQDSPGQDLLVERNEVAVARVVNALRRKENAHQHADRRPTLRARYPSSDELAKRRPQHPDRNDDRRVLKILQMQVDAGVEIAGDQIDPGRQQDDEYAAAIGRQVGQLARRRRPRTSRSRPVSAGGSTTRSSTSTEWRR